MDEIPAFGDFATTTVNTYEAFAPFSAVIATVTVLVPVTNPVAPVTTTSALMSSASATTSTDEVP